MSRIEQLIDEIEEFVEGCKAQPFSQSKVIVPKDELFELLTELRLKTPDEIKRYQKIISNKDAILQDAQAKADKIIEDTKLQVQEMVKESEVMQQAYAQANEIVTLATQQAQEILDKATLEANEMRNAAMQYTDGLLADLENIISHSIDVANSRYENLIVSLKNCGDIVKDNRAALYPLEDLALEAEEQYASEQDAQRPEGPLEIM